MIHIGERNDCSVLIAGPIVGSGLLYAPEDLEYAYILTAAHLIPMAEGQEIQVCIWDKERSGGIHEVTYRMAEKAERTPDMERNCRCKILKGYDKEVKDGPHDGAVIEIPYEEWMGRTSYILGEEEPGNRLDKQRLIGVGFPGTTISTGSKLPKKDCFKCQIERVAKSPDSAVTSEEDLDYVASYDPNQYRTPQGIGNEDLNGFSGTGMFLEAEDGMPERCIGFVSRDAAGSPREYLTNAYRLWLLIYEMQTDHSPVSDYKRLKIQAEYVEYEEILADHTGEWKQSDMESVLKAVLDNPEDYFRCICGYTGIGKSSVVNKAVERRNEEDGISVLHGWHKLMDCLKVSDKETIRDSIFILDPLEQYIEGKERARLFDRSAAREGDAKRQLLAADEKIKLLKEIYDNETDLQYYNIHILFVCHNFFMKDAEEKLKQSEKSDDRYMAAWLEKHYIYCNGFSVEQIQEIFREREGLRTPEYFYDIPILRHPRWVEHILNHEEMQPKGEDEQYPYEFRLYHHTFGWFQRMQDTEGNEWSITGRDSGFIKKAVDHYITFLLENRNSDLLQWDEILSYILWCYPFRETEGGFQMDDEILQSYLIARTIYDKLRDKDEKGVLAGLRAVLDIGKSDRPIQEIWGRVAHFLRELIGRGDSSDEREEYLERLVQKHSEIRDWLCDDKVLLHIEGKGRNAVSLYYNTKTKSYLQVQKENENANAKTVVKDSYMELKQQDTVRKR